MKFGLFGGAKTAGEGQAGGVDVDDVPMFDPTGSKDTLRFFAGEILPVFDTDPAVSNFVPTVLAPT